MDVFISWEIYSFARSERASWDTWVATGASRALRAKKSGFAVRTDSMNHAALTRHQRWTKNWPASTSQDDIGESNHSLSVYTPAHKIQLTRIQTNLSSFSFLVPDISHINKSKFSAAFLRKDFARSLLSCAQIFV
jgi:hypothetical protein